jgi:hypothetical protein
MNAKLKISDLLPFVGAIATGMSSMRPDQIVTCAVGLATFVFTVLKIVQMIRHWDKPRKED